MRTLTFILVASAALGAVIYWRGTAPVVPDEPSSASEALISPQDGPVPNADSQRNSLIPADQGQAGMAAGMTAERVAIEEARQDEQDAREAIDLLHDPDPQKRTEGAEQLAAYQTPQSEVELAQALRGDPEAAVRQAAAQSLVLFEKPTKETWDALLAALEDTNADVQSAAEATVETLLMQYDEKSSRVAWVLETIKKSATSPKLSEDTRDSLQNLIEQLQDAEASP